MVDLGDRKIQEFSHLEMLAKQLVEGFITGLHKSPFHGFSVEFAEHRLYNTGESTRHIDWKLYGRTEKLFVKRYEEETNLRCQIVLDISASMDFPKDSSENKFNFSFFHLTTINLYHQNQVFWLEISVNVVHRMNIFNSKNHFCSIKSGLFFIQYIFSH